MHTKDSRNEALGKGSSQQWRFCPTGERKKGAGAAGDRFFPRASKTRGFCLHKAQKTNLFDTHVGVNTQNTHRTPTSARDTDPFLSGHRSWYTVILE